MNHKLQTINNIKYVYYCGFLCCICCVCSHSTETRPPKIINKTPIEYPLEAIEENVEGQLELAMFILTDGTVDKVEVTNSTGSAVLDSAGVEYARKLKYAPAMQNGMKKSVWLRQRIGFNLQSIYFHPRQWKDKVYSLLRELNGNSGNKRRQLLNSLYTEYIHFASYVRSNPEDNVNFLAQSLVHDTVTDRWKPYWDLVPLSCIMFDDYITRFPDSALYLRARNRLLRNLDDDKFRTEQTLKKARGRQIAQLQELREFIDNYKTEVLKK